MGKRDKKQQVAEKILDVDASMQGTLIFKDPVNLKINGRFEGILTTKGNLMVGETATVNADVTGESIIVAGKVNGNINATKELKLVSPGCVIGDIRTPLLSIAEGAVFDGNCRMITRKEEARVTSSTPSAMTADELAKYLEVEKTLVHEWATAGKLPATREGETWKFDRSKIDEWIASGKTK